MSEPQVGVEVGRFGVEIGRWWQRLARKLRPPTAPPAWHAPQPETVGSGRHHRGDGGVVVAHKLRDGRVMRHYSSTGRDETLTTMVRPGPPADFVPELNQTELVPFRSVEEW